MAMGDVPLSEDCVEETRLTVRFYEADLMGIVHHANYVKYLEIARLEYLSARGIDYLALTDRGFHVPVIEVNVRYKKTVRFSETLVIVTRLSRLTRVRLGFTYELFRETQDGTRTLVATADTLLCCVGGDHRPRPIPDEVVPLLLAKGGRS
jgi:acyl-CoA thioester hydrolase